METIQKANIVLWASNLVALIVALSTSLVLYLENKKDRLQQRKHDQETHKIPPPYTKNEDGETESELPSYNESQKTYGGLLANSETEDLDTTDNGQTNTETDGREIESRLASYTESQKTPLSQETQGSARLHPETEDLDTPDHEIVNRSLLYREFANTQQYQKTQGSARLHPETENRNTPDDGPPDPKTGNIEIELTPTSYTVVPTLQQTVLSSPTSPSFRFLRVLQPQNMETKFFYFIYTSLRDEEIKDMYKLPWFENDDDLYMIMEDLIVILDNDNKKKKLEYTFSFCENKRNRFIFKIAITEQNKHIEIRSLGVSAKFDIAFDWGAIKSECLEVITDCSHAQNIVFRLSPFNVGNMVYLLYPESPITITFGENAKLRTITETLDNNYELNILKNHGILRADKFFVSFGDQNDAFEKKFPKKKKKNVIVY